MTRLDRAITAVRRRSVQLEALRHRVDATERKIREASEDRLARVNSDIEKLRSRAVTDEEVARRYQDLIEERGRLQLVIGQSREILKQ